MAYRHHHRAGGGQLQALLDYEYSPGNLIGHGAFALVFKGRKKKTLEVVAIKQISLKSAPDHLSSIRQKEIEILKEVKHTNVVQLLDYHEEKSHIYLVMEYCNGGDLGDYLQTKHTLCEDSIRHLTNHIANALATLHSQHIIHRDIKPQNLLLSYPSPSPSSSSSSSSSLSGSGGAKCDRTITEATIKLADFGFARHLNGTDMAATLCGSPLYMAPEVLLGERYDGKADLWSIGTIIFQCLTGSAPFLANNPHALRRRYEREKLVAKIPEGTSRHLASLLAKLLRKNPRDRLGHEDLLVHPFLANPSIQASGYLMMAPSPPRAKSSPVPIRRHTPSPSPAPYSSRHSNSPRQSPYEMFVSPSSGPPPSIHPVGSASSLARHHSPHSDVTDHGFILVESPGLSSSPLSLTSSPHSGSYGSTRSHTPSSSGHTPSSYGSSSMQRFRSLTTPFYQATPNSRSSNGSTPTVKGSDAVANSPPNPADFGRPRSHSNTSRRRCSEPQVGVAPLSHTPPFGRLMQLAVAPTTTQSPPTNSFHRQSSSSPSPSSQSGPAYQLGKNVGVAVGGARPTSRGGGMRYSHGSGSKLSSLSEQAEQEDTRRQRGGGQESHRRGSRRGKKAPPANKGDTPSLEKPERRVFLDQLITTSQVLVSDDEEEIEEDEVDFSISFSLQSSQSSNKTEEQEDEEEGGSGSSEVATPKFSVRSGAGRRCKSAGGGEGGRGSFSRQHSEQLTENLQAIHSRAVSLSSHQSWLEGSGDSAHFAPAAITEYHFEVSSAAEIKPVTPTFQLPRGPPSSQSNLPPQPDQRVPHQSREGANLNVELSRERWREEGRGGVRVVGKGVRGGVIGDGEGVRVCLAPLQQAVALAGELTAMAQARQGPIMLLSTDLSSSGGVSPSQRHSEQLVLYAKAVAVLDSGLRQFQIQMAASSCELEQGSLRTAEVDAGEMQETCLERARQLREELDKTGRSSHPSPPSSLHLSAERLLLLEALDMCKHAVLSEQTGETKECVKKYRVAKLIFTHLLSEAKTHRDRTILTNYVQSVTRRIQRLTNNC